MLWLIGQTAIFILIAALIGFLIGWLLRSLWPSGRARIRQGELEAALERASGRISDLETGLRSKRVAATAAAEQEEAARRRVEELEAALASLDSQSDADTGEVERLQSELDAAIGSISTMRNEMADLQADAEAIAALTAERDDALERLAALEPPDTSPPVRQPGLFVVPDSADTVSTADEPAAAPPDPEHEEALRREATALATARFEETRSDEPDDLQQIYGIGPVLERTLHELNITTFRQIADFTDDDVDLVSRALGKAFPDRVRRDDWMSSARELLTLEQADDQTDSEPEET